MNEFNLIKKSNFDLGNSSVNVYTGCQFLNITTNKNALRWGWEVHCILIELNFVNLFEKSKIIIFFYSQGIPFNVILDSVLFLVSLLFQFIRIQLI